MYRQALLFLAALVTPGGLIVWVAWKLLGLVRLRPDVPLPIHSPRGEIIMTTSDWERHIALKHPVRWRITRLLDWPKRRRQRKIKVQPHRDMILSFPFRTLANWVEKNHQKVWFSKPVDVNPLYERYYEAMLEIRELYVWWCRRNDRMAALDKEDPGIVEYTKIEMREEDQLMLARLVNVRNFLD
jgi:hypothetical protein